jgi:diphthine synthase
MGELWFIGAGLGDESDLSRRALGTLRGCTHIFAEEYTSRLAPGSFDRLAAELGQAIVRVPRADVEGERRILAAIGPSNRVALIVPGDPFGATTHLALRRAAEAAGHRWGYVPNASIIVAAAGFLGLMGYKFGRTVSLPFPEPGFAPTSPIDAIGRNRSIGLHTLVLLDLRPEEDRFLRAEEGLRILAERGPTEPGLAPEAPVAVVARVGTPDARAWYGPRAVLETADFGAPLHAIVVPSPELHFEEEAALDRYRVDRRPP